MVNSDSGIDLVALALQLGATFVGRSFSGDKDQLVPLIKAALRHRGAAFIDVLSPCIAFNNHKGSTKSFDWVREHNEAVNRLDVLPGRPAVTASYEPGSLVEVTQHDGSVLTLRKVAADYDPTDRVEAMSYLHQRDAAGEIVTGLLYIDPQAEDLHAALGTVRRPLNALSDRELVPPAAALDTINAALR